MKKFALCFLSIFWGVSFFAEPFSVTLKSQSDCAILERFFRWGFEEQEYGYVLEGIKPISVAEYGGIDFCHVYKDFNLSKKELETILLVESAVSVWNEVCPSHDHYVLKAAPRKVPNSIAPGHEVRFICLPKLREVVQENISLFRYIMDPGAEMEEIVQEIAFSDELLIEVLKGDLTLMGIVLGFGAHNSLIFGRMDSISSLSISADTPPFSAKSVLMKNYSPPDHFMSFLVPQCYGGYYFEYAGGDSSYFKNFHRTRSLLLPGKKFSSLEEEVASFSSKKEKTPSCLEQSPRFIFGAFQGDPSNKQLFKNLKMAQKRIRQFLEKPNFLENTLEKIGGKKPSIPSKKAHRPLSTLDLVGGNTDKWTVILKSHIEHLKDDRQRALFIRAFIHPTEKDRHPPKMLGATKAALKGLETALENLANANAHFQKIAQDPKQKSIIPGCLYFQIDKAGKGESIKGMGQVRIGFTFEDLEGNLLYAIADTWLDLSQTFPGFLHGVQGMRQGETRTIIIHPSYAYGALTTLPPCCTLIVKVQLHEIDEQKTTELPPLQPLDFSWMKDPDYLRAIKDSLDQIPRMRGAFYRKILEEISEVDVFKIKKILEDLKPPGCEHAG